MNTAKSRIHVHIVQRVTDTHLTLSLAFSYEAQMCFYVLLVFWRQFETFKVMNQDSASTVQLIFNIPVIKRQLLTFTVSPCDISIQWEGDDKRMSMWRISPLLCLNALKNTPSLCSDVTLPAFSYRGAIWNASLQPPAQSRLIIAHTQC